MPEAVLLDFNGVLVDDEQMHFETLREALGEAGVSITEEEYGRVYLALDDRSAALAALRRAGRDAAEAEAVARRKAALYAERTRDGFPFFEGAAAVVADLAGRYPLGLVSGAIRAEVEAALRSADLLGAFRVIVAAEDSPASKPDPAPYRTAIERLSAALGRDVAPGRCVAVEDSPGGIESARAAGLKVIAMAQTVPADWLLGSDLILRRLSDLTPIAIERLAS